MQPESIAHVEADAAVKVFEVGGKRCLMDLADYEAMRHFPFELRLNTSGTAYLRIGLIGIHRIITGAAKGTFVDHKNGDSLDNRRANLRVCTAAQNTANKRSHRDSSSPYKGVCRHKDRWRSDVSQTLPDGTRIRFRSHHYSEIDAALASDRKALAVHGPFARLNFPEQGIEFCRSIGITPPAFTMSPATREDWRSNETPEEAKNRDTVPRAFRGRRFTDEQVAELKTLWRKPGPKPSIKSLARKYGVNPTTIIKIRDGLSYRHVTVA